MLGGSRTNIGKVRTCRELSSRVVTFRARLEFFSIAVLKAIRRRHFCGCTGSFVLAGRMVSFFSTNYSRSGNMLKKKSFSVYQGCRTTLLGTDIFKGVSEPRKFKPFTHPQQEHKTVPLNES